MFHESELKIIHYIHQFRTPAIDSFFAALDFFDRLAFFFILVPLIWLWRGWKTGLRLYYVLLLSGLVNAALKGFFLSPRPFHLDPSVGVIHVSGLGFPSGAAQTAALLSGLMLIYWKSSWKWVVAPIYFILLSFSRVYLGVHFITDILGGWLVGLGLLAVYIYLFPLIEKTLPSNAYLVFFLGQALALFLLYTFPSEAHISAIGMILGCIAFVQSRLSKEVHA